MLTSLVGLLLAIGILGVVFGALEARARTRPGLAWWRRPDTKTDLAWFLASPLLTKGVARVALVATAILVLLVSGRSFAAARGELDAGRFPDFGVFGLGPVVRAWPLWGQAFAGLLVGDLAGYWQHRLFHRRRLWPWHAVHHSSPRLDWLSSVRVHPVNEVVARVAQAVPILLLGFDPRVAAGYAPFVTLYAILLHADVRWDFGPLRHVVASPLFHRWHHSDDPEAIDVNFAGLFPAFDLLFGTYHLPRGRIPRSLGAGRTKVPGRFLAQLAFPWRTPRPGDRLASDARPAPDPTSAPGGPGPSPVASAS
jgi:sterol desaturase/sphingolipid hydroxylase (fatty acid hydroxylase superfamily)